MNEVVRGRDVQKAVCKASKFVPINLGGDCVEENFTRILEGDLGGLRKRWII